MIYLGIDLGTSNSCIAYFDSQTGCKNIIKPRVDELALKGGYVIPTTIALNQEGNLMSAGYFANACGQVMGSVVIDKVKLWIGRSFKEVINDNRLQNLSYELTPSPEGYPVIECGGHTYTAENIAAYFLQFLIAEASVSLRKTYNFREEIVELIVTYPAYYLQNQVDAIREAVHQAVKATNAQADKGEDGSIRISGVKIIPEPLATVCAAIAEEKIDRNDKYVLVIDEGAGTLDVMLVNIALAKLDQVSHTRTSVIEAAGITIGGMERLGGVDMDNDIYAWLKDEMQKEHVDLGILNTLEHKQLMTNIEDAKISLAMGRTSEVQIGIPKFCRVKKLSKDVLDSILLETVDQCKKKVAGAIQQIEKDHPGFSRKEISKVILIGGPTQMDLFRKKMFECTGIPPLDGINPMEYVALGAAVSPSVRYSVPVERTYGLIRKKGSRELFESIVKKDTVLPATKVIKYPVDQFEGRIVIEVAQIYEENPVEIICKKMGKYEFFIPPEKNLFYIIFKIDEERKVEVAVTDSSMKLNKYVEGIIDPSIFRLEFSRECDQIPSVIRKDDAPPLDPAKMKAIRKYAPHISRYIGDAIEQEKIADLVLSFDLDPDKRQRIDELKNEVDIYSNALWHTVLDMVENIEMVGEVVSEKSIEYIKQKEREIRDSDDLKSLVMKNNAIKKEFEDIRDVIKYGRGTIQELLEQISQTESKAAEIIKKRSAGIPEQRQNEIRALMNELDRIKKILERKRTSDILVMSLEGAAYRDGASREQMLKCIIDQMA